MTVLSLATVSSPTAITSHEFVSLEDHEKLRNVDEELNRKCAQVEAVMLSM